MIYDLSKHLTFQVQIYLNDFETFVRQRYSGIDLLPPNLKRLMFDNNIDVFLKLFSLLYADDTLILASSEDELQLALNALNEYCKSWSLCVNVNKTKIVIFSRGKVRKFRSFILDDEVVEVVDEYT